jgi:hypothetical protein
MSFVDLMKSDVWSEADIVRRTESIIRGEFSAEAETILNRKTTGSVLGTYKLSETDLADLNRYVQVCEAAQADGQSARKDMALLREVLSIEPSYKRLLVSEVSPEYAENGSVLNQAQIDADKLQRSEAEAVLAAASIPAINLCKAINSSI